MDPAGRDAAFAVLFQQSEWHKALIVRPPDKVYHYTTAAGFRSIVGEALMRATNFAFLNDPSELKYGKELTLQLLERAAQSVLPARRDLIAEMRRAVETKAVLQVYIACFTTLRDDLKLRTEYCGSGPERYCIGFDARKLAAEFNTRPGGRFAKVVYERLEQEELIASIVERCLAIVEKKEIARESWDGMADAFARVIHTRLPELKDPGHEWESEWRIIRWHDQLEHDVVSFDSREPPRPFLPVALTTPLFESLDGISAAR
jgi:Protein of unknown function (DUF2971)